MIEEFPLIEAIFELRWGQKSPGVFDYSPEEQQLFAMQISSAATTKGYSHTELTNPSQNFFLPPHFVSHRFRKEANTWPCFQIGLGIFTINQVKDGYAWEIFNQTIKEGLEIYNKADPKKLINIHDTLTLVLRYQNAFFPSGISTQQYILDKLNFNVSMPESFFDNISLEKELEAININLATKTHNPDGMLSIILANAVINNTQGLLMEIIVEAEAKSIAETLSIDDIAAWAEKAHTLQRHSFKNLVK